MIEVFLVSLTGPQIIFLFAVTIIGGLFVGAFAYLTYEVVMGFGIILVVQFLLFWTSRLSGIRHDGKNRDQAEGR